MLGRVAQALIGISLAASASGDMKPPLEACEAVKAVRSQTDAGSLASGEGFQPAVKDSRRWYLSAKRRLHEFHGPGRERIALEVPRAGEMREKESRLWLASNSEKDPELPPDFLKCSEYASGKKPHPSIFPLNAQIVNSHFGFVIKLGSTKKYAIVEDSFRFTAAHSKPGLRANGPTAMKYTWFYKRPKGSLYKIEGRRQGEVLDIKIDAVGVHLMALRVEDDSGECNTASVELLVTANPPYIFPSFSIKELEEAFSMKWFKPHLDKIQARKSWKYSQGEGVTIAVLDSGVNYFHPLLMHNIKTNDGEVAGNGIDDDGNGFVDDYTGWDFYHNDPHPFDDDGHGSRVAGLAASSLSGVAKKAKILPIKVSAFATFESGTLAAAIRYAVDQGSEVINISLSAPTSPSLFNAVRYARDAGVVIVAVTGNDGRLNPVVFPASYAFSNVVSVAATGEGMGLAPYSNYGDRIADVAAPGGTTSNSLRSLSSYNLSGYLFIDAWGTSLAAPMVAGLAAQVLSINPKLRPEEVIDIIMSTGDAHPDLKGKVKLGRRINALNAVLKAVETTPEWMESSLGLTRSERRKIQQGLIVEGYNPGPVDGLFGRKTRSAIKNWQKSLGADQSGYLDAESAKALIVLAEKHIEN